MDRFVHKVERNMGKELAAEYLSNLTTKKRARPWLTWSASKKQSKKEQSKKEQSNQELSKAKSEKQNNSKSKTEENCPQLQIYCTMKEKKLMTATFLL